MMRLPHKNVLLGIFGLAAVMVGFLALAFQLHRAQQLNRELHHSLQLLERGFEQERKQHLRRFDSLQQDIGRQEERHELLKRKLVSLRRAGAEINKKAHEEKNAILRLRAVDSLWHEIARHYRP